MPVCGVKAVGGKLNLSAESQSGDHDREGVLGGGGAEWGGGSGRASALAGV